MLHDHGGTGSVLELGPKDQNSNLDSGRQLVRLLALKDSVRGGPWVQVAEAVDTATRTTPSTSISTSEPRVLGLGPCYRGSTKWACGRPRVHASHHPFTFKKGAHYGQSTPEWPVHQRQQVRWRAWKQSAEALK
jgi:hypothetical protein